MKGARKLHPAWLLSVPVFYLFWIVFVGTFSLHELLLGFAGSILATTGLFIIDFYLPARFAPKFAEVLLLWRIPWYLISGTWEITAIAGKDLLGVETAKSLFRVVPFNAGTKENAHNTARRVLAVAYMTMTPTTIVLGVNTSDQKLLLHEMRRSSIPRMLKDLGAQA